MLFEIQVKELANGYTVVVWYKGNKESETFYSVPEDAYAAAKGELNDYLG